MRMLAFRVREDLVKALKVKAAEADISMARYIERVLEEHLKEKGGKK